MSTAINVVRYHLVDRIAYLVGPWAVLAFVFIVNVAITAAQAGGPNPTKALAAIYLYFFALGLLGIGRDLPFGLALGASRRSYYAATALLAIALAAVYGLGLTLLQVAERATHGWGLTLHFFQVSYILSGPWYLTWLTSFVGLALLFTYGMCYGIVYLRWNRGGLVVFIVVQVALIRAWILLAAWGHSWPGLSRIFAAPSADLLTAELAVVTVALLVGGFLAVRRLAI